MKRTVVKEPTGDEKRMKFTNDDWGDSDIDEYLLQATQNCEKQILETNLQEQPNPLNESLNYSMFNKNPNMAASTQNQLFTWAQPTPLAPAPSNQNNEQTEIERLKNELMLKTGEVSLLRSQIKDIKQQHDQKKEETYKQMSQKLDTLKSKEKKVSTELEFKTFENANLKMKLSSFLKNPNITAVSSVIVRPTVEVDSHNFTIMPTSGIWYPLKGLIPSEIFESDADDAFPDVKHKTPLSDECYMHSKVLADTEPRLSKGVYTDVRFGKRLKLKHFFHVIRRLKGLTIMELQLEKDAINQIYLLAYTLLSNQLEYLSAFCKQVKSDEIQEIDLDYLNNPVQGVNVNCDLLNPRSWSDDVQECGIQCRQTLTLLTLVLRHNKYLQNLLLNKWVPSVSEKERVTWPYGFPNIFASNDMNMLKLLLTITLKIGKTRRSTEYCGLLSAIANFLGQLISLQDSKVTMYFLIGQIAKEIVLALPPYPVLMYVSELLRQGRNCKEFIELLCTMPTHAIVKKDKPRRIIIVNNTCCFIEIYFNQCIQAMSDVKHANIDKNHQLHYKLLEFIAYCLSNDIKWMHFTEGNPHTSCQTKLYKLAIDVVYRVLVTYKKLTDATQEIPCEILNSVRIAPMILEVFTHKYEFAGVSIIHNAILHTCKRLLRDLNTETDNSRMANPGTSNIPSSEQVIDIQKLELLAL